MSKRKLIAAGVVTLVVLIAVTAAWAWYGGSGASAATNAKAGASPVAVNVAVDASAAQALYPGDSAPIGVTVSSVGNRSAHVGSITLSLGTLAPGCSSGWFTLTDPSGLPAGANVSPGNPLEVGGAIAFDESGTDQSACSLADLPITATASPTP